MQCKPFVILWSETDISQIIEFVQEAQSKSKGYLRLGERYQDLEEDLRKWFGEQLPIQNLIKMVENFDLWDVCEDSNLLARRYFIGCIVDHFILSPRPSPLFQREDGVIYTITQ